MTIVFVCSVYFLTPHFWVVLYHHPQVLYLYYPLPCFAQLSGSISSPACSFLHFSCILGRLTVVCVSCSLQDRWGEPDYSSFSPRRLPSHQGHSCVWIMSEARSKYLSMTSCLDWCSCAIWCFMYHTGVWPCQSGAALEHWDAKGPSGAQPRHATLPKMSLWLWVVLIKRYIWYGAHYGHLGTWINSALNYSKIKGRRWVSC